MRIIEVLGFGASYIRDFSVNPQIIPYCILPGNQLCVYFSTKLECIVSIVHSLWEYQAFDDINAIRRYVTLNWLASIGTH